jgi:hypothetical protein
MEGKYAANASFKAQSLKTEEPEQMTDMYMGLKRTHGIVN